MIFASSLEMRYGTRVLFSGADLEFMSGSRYALVGANGSGKTTLLRIITGEEPPTDGRLVVQSGARIGFLRQDQFRYEEMPIISAVLEGRPRLVEARRRMNELLECDDFGEKEAEAFSRLEAEAEREGGRTAESEAASILVGLGIAAARHHDKASTLSGGWKVRMLLAQALFGAPDALLLDEPTNHLDLPSIRWLEDYLSKWKGVLVFTSHDRHFVNAVCTHVADIDFGTIRVSRGSYDDYLRRIGEEREQRESTLAASERRIGQLNKFVERFRAKATKARQAQSKERLIEKMRSELEELPILESSRRTPRFRFCAARSSGVIPLRVEGIAKSFGGRRVLSGVALEVERGDRVAIVGTNGIGKTTLLKILAGVIPPDAGSFKWGHQADLSYMPQDLAEEFLGENTALGWLSGRNPSKEERALRGVLAANLFSGDDSGKRVSSLSGGELARLFLADIATGGANVMLLDEPTSHLDIAAVDALSGALCSFAGTIILVTHDRWFVERVATRILEITPHGLVDHRGSYEELVNRTERDHLERGGAVRPRSGAAAANKQAAASPASPASVPPGGDRRELSRRERTARASVSRLEAKISEAEQFLASLDDRMGAPAFYERTGLAEQLRVKQEAARLRENLSALMAQWEKAGAELEKLRRELA